MNCSFCGLDFDMSQADLACTGCPLVKGCRLIRCPRCGYEMPPESKLVNWMRGWNARLKEKNQPTSPFKGNLS